MAKFANDILIRSAVVTQQLGEELGQDTTELQLRVGLHSGSVTGGVLRGQKYRFQLFGDVRRLANALVA